MVPEAQVEALVQMYTAEEEDALLDGQPDYVIDAIDNIDTKVALLAACKRRGIPVICVAGAGDGTHVLTPQDSDNVPNISADEGKECCRQWHTMPFLCMRALAKANLAGRLPETAILANGYFSLEGATGKGLPGRAHTFQAVVIS